MGSLPDRLVLKQNVVITTQNAPVFDWRSDRGDPREIAAIRVTSLFGRKGGSLPIAYVTPIIFTVARPNIASISNGQFYVMDGTQVLVNRDAIDVGATFRVSSPPGQVNWGLGVHLIKGCLEARIEYWQWT